MQTTYSMDILPSEHPVFKPEMIPMDFSAFNNFNIAKHSYWEKTPAEINTFLTTGQFPETNTNASAAAVQTPNTQPYAPAQSFQPASVNPVASYTGTPATPVNTSSNPTVVSPVNPVIPVAGGASETPASSDTPVRNFSGFSF
jgi:hypothetical protein